MGGGRSVRPAHRLEAGNGREGEALVALGHRRRQRGVRAGLERQGLDRAVLEADVEVSLNTAKDAIGSGGKTIGCRDDGLLDAGVKAGVEGIDEGLAVLEV